MGWVWLHDLSANRPEPPGSSHAYTAIKQWAGTTQLQCRAVRFTCTAMHSQSHTQQAHLMARKQAAGTSSMHSVMHRAKQWMRTLLYKACSHMLCLTHTQQAHLMARK